MPPPARGCSINEYKTLNLLQYIIVFSSSILVKCSCALVVKCSCAACAPVVKSGCKVVKMVKAVKNGATHVRRRATCKAFRLSRPKSMRGRKTCPSVWPRLNTELAPVFAGGPAACNEYHGCAVKVQKQSLVTQGAGAVTGDSRCRRSHW